MAEDRIFSGFMFSLPCPEISDWLSFLDKFSLGESSSKLLDDKSIKTKEIP